MEWTYYIPGYYVSFMPSDYKWGAWGSFEGRPEFWGLGSDSYWCTLLAGPVEWTRLTFYYLEVSNYARGGIVPEGRSSPGKWNGYNSVYGMYFSYLGTKYASGAGGYAGVFLVNSRNNIERRGVSSKSSPPWHASRLLYGKPQTIYRQGATQAL
jgi:hypothetical protein